MASEITSLHTENTEVARIVAAHNLAMRFAAEQYQARFNEAYQAIRKAEAEGSR
jgi:hypothetical protein